MTLDVTAQFGCTFVAVNTWSGDGGVGGSEWVLGVMREDRRSIDMESSFMEEIGVAPTGGTSVRVTGSLTNGVFYLHTWRGPLTDLSAKRSTCP